MGGHTATPVSPPSNSMLQPFPRFGAYKVPEARHEWNVPQLKATRYLLKSIQRSLEEHKFYTDISSALLMLRGPQTSSE